MKQPKTVKGYISLMKKVEKISIAMLKGYQNLSDTEQYNLGLISAGLANDITDFERINQ